MNRTFSRILLAVLAGPVVLAGCDTVRPLINKPTPVVAKPAQPPAARPAPATPAPVTSQGSDQGALKDGIELYNKGAYNEAIKRLNSAEISSGPKANQVQAHKYMAFSYCLTSRQTLCRQQFEKAFKLDAGFDLQTGEHGHPLWTPMFERAKKAAAK